MSIQGGRVMEVIGVFTKCLLFLLFSEKFTLSSSSFFDDIKYKAASTIFSNDISNRFP